LLFLENSLSRHRLVTVSQTLKNLVTTRSPFRVLRQHSFCQERLHQPTEIFSANFFKVSLVFPAVNTWYWRQSLSGFSNRTLDAPEKRD